MNHMNLTQIGCRIVSGEIGNRQMFTGRLMRPVSLKAIFRNGRMCSQTPKFVHWVHHPLQPTPQHPLANARWCCHSPPTPTHRCFWHHSYDQPRQKIESHEQASQWNKSLSLMPQRFLQRLKIGSKGFIWGIKEHLFHLFTLLNQIQPKISKILLGLTPCS